MSTQTLGARPSPQPAAATPQHLRLEVFAGNWSAQGHQHEGVVGPAAKISAIERFEWLPGGFFLVHHFEGRVGRDEASCIEITGYDSVSRSYPTRTYYNNGQRNDWDVREENGIWMFTGDWPTPDGSMKVRCTVEFSNSGGTRTAKWEHSTSGAAWRTFWDVTAIRI
ncbi:MAG: DUF1579 family protein [Gemmatimonadota bacterium]